MTSNYVSRRSFLAAAGSLTAAAFSQRLHADDRYEYGPGAPPRRYPDVEIIALDPRFKKYATPLAKGAALKGLSPLMNNAVRKILFIFIAVELENFSIQ